MKLWNSIFGKIRHASLPPWNVCHLVIKFLEPLKHAFQGNEAKPELCHRQRLPWCLKIKARGHGLGQQANVFPGTGWGWCWRRGSVPPRRLPPRARAKQVWAVGQIKGTFGNEPDGMSWPICKSHTVVPQSHNLIIIYQEYLLRDVGGKWVSS